MPMPNITVIGEKPEQKPKLKPIEFKKILYDGKMQSCDKEGFAGPTDWKNIELVCRNYCNGFDMIFCYQDDRNGVYQNLYLGHWNDGVV